MKASLFFNSTKDRTNLVRLDLIGVKSLNQAEAAGHGLCGALSLEKGESVYLANVTMDNGDFVAIPPPDYWMRNIIVER